MPLISCTAPHTPFPPSPHPFEYTVKVSAILMQWFLRILQKYNFAKMRQSGLPRVISQYEQGLDIMAEAFRKERKSHRSHNSSTDAELEARVQELYSPETLELNWKKQL